MSTHTDITVLLDRSGSMSSIRESMESALATFVSEHKAVPSTRFTLIQFDDINNQQVVVQNVPIGSVERVTIKPRGNTPLIDAFTKAINATGERLADLDEAKRPSKVIFIVITDGEENSSKLFKRSDVASRVSKQSGTYNWQFVYLGANQDSFKEAQSYGINPSWAINYNATKGGTTGAMRGLTSNTLNYASGNSSSVESFTKAQRDEASELTTK